MPIGARGDGVLIGPLGYEMPIGARGHGVPIGAVETACQSGPVETACQSGPVETACQSGPVEAVLAGPAPLIYGVQVGCVREDCPGAVSSGGPRSWAHLSYRTCDGMEMRRPHRVIFFVWQ